MLSRLLPLGVNVRFEDRIYRLGDTIDLALELSPRRDIEIREGSVELVCEENWTEVTTVMVRRRPTRLGPHGGGRVVLVPPEPKQVSKKRRATYIHSRTVFLREGHLQSGLSNLYSVGLSIGPELPPHASQATTSWRLVTTVDVVGARVGKHARA